MRTTQVYVTIHSCSLELQILIAGYTLDFLRDTDENRRDSTQAPVNTSVSTSALLKVIQMNCLLC